MMNKKDNKECKEHKKHDKKDHKSHEKKELCNCKKREQELIDSLQRSQAEFENFRKRVDRDRESFCKFASEGIIKKILPVMENFERSLNSKDKENHDEFVKAIDMIHNQLLDVLEKEGLKRIDAEAKPFDPELHEPLLQEESDEKPNTVLEVLQPGYTLNDKVIQHARVKISKEKTK